MTIDLTPEVEGMIREGLRLGPYRTANEFVAEAVQLLLQQENWLAENHDEIAARIEEGWASAERGELIDGDEVRGYMEERKKAFLAGRKGA